VSPSSPFPLLPRTHLRGFDRVSVPVMEWLNRRPGVKNALHSTIGHFNGAWITATSGRMWQIHGQDGLRRLDAPDGLVLVSNHRSFFDMYAITTVVLNEARHLEKRVCFPVRSTFFYTNPLGLLLNIAISGGSMWPPVFRDERRRTLNPAGLDQMAAWLQRGAVIGIHPEGTRGKGPDLYEFLPLKPGLGQLLERAPRGTLVQPVFIGGFGNDILLEMRRGFRKPDRRGTPVRIRFGQAQLADELRQAGDAMAVTEAAMAEVRRLADVDRGEFRRS
jgi:1-acyl-sn-glycerol-3-phosphate acyltransferase